MTTLKFITAAIVAALALSLPVQAQSVLTEFNNGLYDTGLANATSGNNAVTLAGGSTELHYILSSPPAGAGTSALVVHNANLPATTIWVANQTAATPPSRWISSSATAASQPLGLYNYVLTLSAIPVNSNVSISGNFASDNGLAISANGVQKFTSTASPTALSSFSFSFVSSSTLTTDTITFGVTNSTASLTGLQVTGLTGSYTPVPEPKEWAGLMLLGAGLLVMVRKLRGSLARKSVA